MEPETEPPMTAPPTPDPTEAPTAAPTPGPLLRVPLGLRLCPQQKVLAAEGTRRVLEVF